MNPHTPISSSVSSSTPGLPYKPLSLNRLAMIGINFKSAPLEMLEQVSLNTQEIHEFYTLLEKPKESHSAQALQDTFVVSTCNRTEVYCLPKEDIDCTELISKKLQQVVGEQRFPNNDKWYRKHGIESIKHLFRVACGLDSMIVGESQILGQIKSALADRQSYTPISPVFENIALHAFKAAKKSRTHTEIGAGAVSVASAAVQLCQRIYSDLSKHHVVIIGAGETGKLSAEHFAQKGAKKVTIVNRNEEKGLQLAQQIQGNFISFENLPASLKDVQIVVSAIKTDAPIINKALF